ncbi:magnesium citrate secondary transporter [Hymenobacter ruber]
MHLLNRCVLHVPLPALVTSYLADVLALPVMLTLALAVQRRLGNHSRHFILPDTWLLASWLFVSVWFEGILPSYSRQAVADPLDVVAYALGTLAFRQWLNRPA